MYNNPFYNQSFNLDRLNRMKEDIEKQIQSCQNHQQQPINNFINTNQPQSNMYELKKLNDGDEVENMLNKRVNYPIGYGNQNPNYTEGQFVILSCSCLNARGTESTTTEGTGNDMTTDEVNPNTRKK